jgi:hypothetical protein
MPTEDLETGGGGGQGTLGGKITSGMTKMLLHEKHAYSYNIIFLITHS